MAYTDEDKQKFLDELRNHGNRTTASRAIGVSYNTVDRWREGDADFDRAYEEALEEAADLLEQEARRRAVEGTTRKRYDKDGNLISEEQVYSDSLLSKLLDGAKPDKYKQRVASEMTGAGGTPLVPSDTSAAARLVSILEAARQRAKVSVSVEVDPLS